MKRYSIIRRLFVKRVHTDVNRTTMVQSANFFGLSKQGAVFADLFNRVFHTFCEELLFAVE
jgi:hypothetical protein